MKLPDSDARLVRRAKRGSGDAIEALIRRHWRTAYRSALLIVHDASAAEDIAQESMLAAVRSLDRFDWWRPMAPWLHRIVVNNSLDHLRASRRRAELGTETFERASGGDGRIGLDQRSSAVATALSRLEPTDRAIVVLRHLLDYRSAEIGELLEMPAATVRTRLRRAMAQLRDMVEIDQATDQEVER